MRWPPCYDDRRVYCYIFFSPFKHEIISLNAHSVAEPSARLRFSFSKRVEFATCWCRGIFVCGCVRFISLNFISHSLPTQTLHCRSVRAAVKLPGKCIARGSEGEKERKREEEKKINCCCYFAEHIRCATHCVLHYTRTITDGTLHTLFVVSPTILNWLNFKIFGLCMRALFDEMHLCIIFVVCTVIQWLYKRYTKCNELTQCPLTKKTY